jgi:hypothetical protein
VAAAQACLVAEEQRNDLEPERECDCGHDEAAVEPGAEPSGREREDETDETGDEQVLDRLADRVEPGRVRVDQQAREPGEAGEGHQRAESVVGPGSPREQAADEERRADEDRQQLARLRRPVVHAL